MNRQTCRKNNCIINIRTIHKLLPVLLVLFLLIPFLSNDLSIISLNPVSISSENILPTLRHDSFVRNQMIDQNTEPFLVDDLYQDQDRIIKNSVFNASSSNSIYHTDYLRTPMTKDLPTQVPSTFSNMGINYQISSIPDYFYICSDDDLLAFADLYELPGSGTTLDPIVIDGFTFNSVSISCTTLHLTIRNCVISPNSFASAITLWSVENIKIESNELFNGAFGIEMWTSSNNEILDNNIHDCSFVCIGIYYGSTSNTFSGNTIENGAHVGMQISNSPNNVITDNIFINEGIQISGISLADFYQTDTSNNVVNGQEIYFAYDQYGGTIPTNIGQLVMVNCHNIELTGFSFTSGGRYGFCIHLSSFINIHHNTFSNLRSAAIFMLNSTDAFIDHNTCYNNRDGLGYICNSERISVTNNIVEFSVLSGFGLYFSDNNIISNNEIYNGQEHGISCINSQYNEFSFNNIHDNQFNGILLDRYDYPPSDPRYDEYGFCSNYCVLDQNIIHSNGYSGIAIGISSYSIVTYDTTISNNEIFNNGGSGIKLINSYNSNILYNTIYSNEWGIDLWSSDENLIEGNWIHLNDFRGVGIGYSINNRIVDNIIELNGEHGIHLDYTDNINISFNTIQDNAFCGVGDVFSTNGLIHNNEIINNPEAGISLYYSNNFQVFQNYVHDNPSLSIWLDNSNCCVISDNVVEYNYHGIITHNSMFCTFNNNEIRYNSLHGLRLINSGSNTITGNTFTQDGLIVYGVTLDHWLQTDVSNNFVNSKPILYYQGVNDFIISTSAGQIFIIDCDNVEIYNQNIQNTANGIMIIHCEYIDVHDCIFSNIDWNGGWIQMSNHSIISNNVLQYNSYSLYLKNCFDIIITNNLISDSYRGIIFVGYDDYLGAYTTDSRNHYIYGNNISYCTHYGIFLVSIFDSDIKWNNLINNNIGGSSQAHDSVGDGNLFEYNHWSDWTSPDVDSNGFVDNPYTIDGDAISIDQYPFVTSGNHYGYTPVGTTVSIDDPQYGVILTYDEITTEGVTSVIVSESPPSPPTGFELAGDYYDITTSASYTGLISLSINYDETQISDEQNLKLMHWNEDTQLWEDITTSVDIVNNIIYGETISFSIFALMEVFDIEPPSSIITVENYLEDEYGAIFVTRNSAFTIFAEDTGSGVLTSYYRIDYTEWLSYSMPFSIAGFFDGFHTIEFFSTDKSGNNESTKTLDVYLISINSDVGIFDEDGNELSYFDLVFATDKSGYYTLVATNPGQFFIQATVINDWSFTMSTLSINQDIPNDFVLKGSEPIHIYQDGVDITERCLINGLYFEIYNVSPGTVITVVIHVDYGLKGSSYPTLEDFIINPYSIENQITAQVDDGFTDISNQNTILIPHQKKTTAIAGFLYDSQNQSVCGVTVLLLDANGNIVSHTISDEFGFYYFIDIEAGFYIIRVNTETNTIDIDVEAIFKELVQLDTVIEDL